MPRLLETRVCNEYLGFTFKGEVGKHGELVKATWYQKTRPIISLESDMHRLVDFDGLLALNTQGEIGQLLGVYFHGDISPFTWKTLADAIILHLHKAVGKGRAVRKVINALKLIDGKVWVGDQVFCCGHHGNIFTRGSVLGDPLLGSDTRFIEKQCQILFNVLEKPSKGPSVRFVHKERLVSKVAERKPLCGLESV